MVLTLTGVKPLPVRLTPKDCALADAGRDGFWYLATPYTKYGPKLPRGVALQSAFNQAAFSAAPFVRAGIPVFSPIAHTHPIAMYGGIDPLDWRMWVDADAVFVAAAVGCVVVKMAGYAESAGVRHEIAAFRSTGRPVLFCQPGELPPEWTDNHGA